MNTKQILISMARYIHAVYDIEINTDSTNLVDIVKKHVEKLALTDETLETYWESYRESVASDEKLNSVDNSKATSNNTGEGLFYRQVAKPESR